PQYATIGDGAMNYHWYYFALPAWISEFAGMKSPVAHSLILCNFPVAALLIATLATITSVELNAAASRPLVLLTVALVVFAPFTTYTYQTLISALHSPWFTAGARNNLMLSPLNSMVIFGNNTLAAVMGLMACALVRVWNESPRAPLAIIGGILVTLIIAYSATLFFPLVAALGIWTLIGRVRTPLRAILLAAPALVVGVVVLRLTHVLGGSKESLVFSFDRGQFIQNVVFGMAPVVLLVAISVFARRRASLFQLLLLSCLCVPTFLALSESRTGDAVLSMKIATMLALSATPIIAGALVWLASRRGLWPIVGVVVLAGVANSGAYVFQYAAMRATGRGERVVEIPRDYFNSLDWIRRHTPGDAIVLDPAGGQIADVIITVPIAERRVWLPTAYSMQFVSDAARQLMLDRTARWEAWESTGFQDSALSSGFARAADVLLVREPAAPPASDWRESARFGGYSIYLSQLRARGESRQ
ncbi:MAG: hypothetical protein ACREJC_10565, partial [Tepidisphaeraceae bacterium]